MHYVIDTDYRAKRDSAIAISRIWISGNQNMACHIEATCAQCVRTRNAHIRQREKGERKRESAYSNRENETERTH